MINLINDFNNIFIIRSFSKTFGLPSIRVGCLIGNEKNMNTISNYRPAYEISYPSLKISEYFLDNRFAIVEPEVPDPKIQKSIISQLRIRIFH